MANNERICALELKERHNLDAEMSTLIKGIEKKYGFMPHFIRLFATDNRRLRAFMTQYMETMREDSGLTPLEHEMIALVSAATNGCVYCTVTQLQTCRTFGAASRDAGFCGAGVDRR